MDPQKLFQGEDYALSVDGIVLRGRFIGDHSEGANTRYTRRRNYAHFVIIDEGGNTTSDVRLIQHVHSDVIEMWNTYCKARQALQFLGLPFDPTPRRMMISEQWVLGRKDLAHIAHRLEAAGIALERVTSGHPAPDA